jgi:hypothetical protein
LGHDPTPILAAAGITMIERFIWVTYPFAALILFAAWRLLFGVERERTVVAITQAGSAASGAGAHRVRLSGADH